MKNLLLYLLLFPTLLAAQSSAEINELRFPYRKGYHMSYKGEVIEYDRYNFPAKSKPTSFSYYIADEEKDKDRWVVNFQYHSVSDTDTVIMDKTFLYIDEEGMFFWLENDPANTRNGEEMKGKERKTQAIMLPLTKDKKWKSFDYGDDKAEFFVTTLDTVIELKKGGPVHCFGVSCQTVVQRTKDYVAYRRSTDYYNQDIGKVATNTLVFLVITENDQMIRAYEETYLLDDYYKD